MKQQKNNATNEEKQKQKREANPTEGIKQQISDDLVRFAEGTQSRLAKNFRKLLRERNWRNVDMFNALYPIVTDKAHASKLYSGERPINFRILVVLHKAYGVDLNEFIAGDRAERPSITPEQVEALRAIVKMYDDFSENQGKSDNKSCQ